MIFIIERDDYVTFTEQLMNLLTTTHAWYLEDGSNQYRKRELETNLENAIETFKKLEWKKSDCKEYKVLMEAIDSSLTEFKIDPCSSEKYNALSHAILDMLKTLYIV